MNNFDAIIIGFGKGGKTLASTLAKQGQRVAMIEKSAAMYGGTCININRINVSFLVLLTRIFINMRLKKKMS